MGLVEGVSGGEPRISSFDMTELYFKVTYSIDKTAESDGNDILFLDITQCATTEGAEQKMKNHMRGFQGKLKNSVCRPKDDLGSHALQSYTSVFWVRDTVFINVSGEGMSVPRGPERSFNTAGASDASAAVLITNPLIDQLIPITQKIDKHLKDNSVRLSQQPKPRLTLETRQPVYVQMGTRFTLTLNITGDVHKLKPAKIGNPDLIFQAANGTDKGKYEFFAMNAGSTNVKLIVAHKNSLAVACEEVEVVVITDRRD